LATLKEWQYERDNSFVLPARLVERSNTHNGCLLEIRPQYNRRDSRQALEETVGRAGGRLYDTARTTAGCPMEYGRVIMPQIESNYMSGRLGWISAEY